VLGSQGSSILLKRDEKEASFAEKPSIEASREQRRETFKEAARGGASKAFGSNTSDSLRGFVKKDSANVPFGSIKVERAQPKKEGDAAGASPKNQIA